MKNLPNFKYHSHPLKTGSIVKKQTDCPVCHENKEYVYEGPFYSTEDVEGICPWCIADGNAAKKFDGEFQDYCSIEGISPKLNEPNTISYKKEDIDILISKTPGYSGWQQEVWLGHCDEPCSFEGYVGWKEIKEAGIDVEEDLDQQAKMYRMTKNEFCERLQNNGSIQGYLFKCVKCGKFRLTTDCN